MIYNYYAYRLYTDWLTIQCIRIAKNIDFYVTLKNEEDSQGILKQNFRVLFYRL